RRRMHRIAGPLRVAVLLLVAALAAAPVWPSAAVADVPGQPPRALADSPGLTLVLATDAPEYVGGAPVTFTVAVDNRGDAPVTVVFPSAKLFDIVVLAVQQEVWRWSADRDFAQVETERTFPPGVTLLDRVTWEWRDASGVRLQPGVYQVQGSLA